MKKAVVILLVLSVHLSGGYVFSEGFSTKAEVAQRWTTVTFWTNWNRVTVQFRKGRQHACVNMPFLEEVIMYRGRDHAIKSYGGEDICYRRDSDPRKSDGQWTTWVKVSVVGSRDKRKKVN